MRGGRKSAGLSLMALSCAVVLLLAFFHGCSHGAGDAVDKTSDAHVSTSETIQLEVMKKISDKVLGDIPNNNELARVRERGVLRVALPPGESEYVKVDPEFGMPGGLFPALLSEISNVMLLKLNMEALSEEDYSKLLKGDNYDKYDIFVVLDEVAACPYQTRVFYNVKDGWKSLCVASDKGDEMWEALNGILNYLNKSGIFARIYDRYAEK